MKHIIVVLLCAFVMTAFAQQPNVGPFTGLKIASIHLDGDKRIPGPKDIRLVASELRRVFVEGGAEFTPGRGTRIVGGISRKEAGAKNGGGLYGAEVSAYSKNKQTLFVVFSLSRQQKYTEQEFAVEAAAQIAKVFTLQMPAHLKEVARQRDLLNLPPEK